MSMKIIVAYSPPPPSAESKPTHPAVNQDVSRFHPFILLSIEGHFSFPPFFFPTHPNHRLALFSFLQNLGIY